VLVFGGFAEAMLVEEAERHDLTVTELIGLGAEHYVGELDSRRAAVRIPPTMGESPFDDGMELELELHASTWQVLELAARAEDTSVERVIVHATLLLLADLDAGRVAARVAGARD
jgi:hypothetical protein